MNMSVERLSLFSFFRKLANRTHELELDAFNISSFLKENFNNNNTQDLWKDESTKKTLLFLDNQIWTTRWTKVQDPFYNPDQSWAFRIILPILMLILLIFFYFCIRAIPQDQVQPPPDCEAVPNAANNLGSSAPRTPPPSYSILIENGDSLYTPPTYKMLFPQTAISQQSGQESFAASDLITVATNSLSIGNTFPSTSQENIRFSLNPRGGSIQKTTISYKMDVDTLTVTTELKSINFTSAVIAKNVWMAVTNQRKNQTDSTVPTTTTATPTTAEMSASSSTASATTALTTTTLATSTTTAASTTTTSLPRKQDQDATVFEEGPPAYFVILENETFSD